MKVDFLKPDPTFSKKLSLEFTEALKASLLYLLQYFEEYLYEVNFEEAHAAIKGISDAHSEYWYICAINRRLCDLALKAKGTSSIFYFKQICSFIKKSNMCSELIPINKLTKIQRSLFTSYATELSYSDKNIFHRITEMDYRESKKALDAAVKILNRYIPNFYKEHENLVNSLILFDGDHISSGSTFSLGKCAYLKSVKKFNKRNIFIFIDRIIHETAHLFLHFLSKDDPFVINPPEKLFKSPFRDDGRPMIGIFHAHFVLFRLIMAFSVSPLRNELKDTGIEESLLKYRAAFEDTKAILLCHGEFTELGQNIFKGTLSY